MLASVVCLRKDGERLPVEQLLPGMRCVLMTALWAIEDGRRIYALRARALYSVGCPDQIPPLLDARVTRSDHRGMVLSGFELINGTQLRQSWWVRSLPQPIVEGQPNYIAGINGAATRSA